MALTEVWAKAAKAVVLWLRKWSNLSMKERAISALPMRIPCRIREKIEAIATKIYGADGVDFVGKSASEIDTIESLGFRGLPVCIAKTQYSLSDDMKKLGRPRGFRISIRGVKVSAGAGFVVALAGDIMTMPGLPKVPACGKHRCGQHGKNHRSVLNKWRRSELC